jgi:urease accessory protein UreF
MISYHASQTKCSTAADPVDPAAKNNLSHTAHDGGAFLSLLVFAVGAAAPAVSRMRDLRYFVWDTVQKDIDNAIRVIHIDRHPTASIRVLISMIQPSFSLAVSLNTVNDLDALTICIAQAISIDR